MTKNRQKAETQRQDLLGAQSSLGSQKALKYRGDLHDEQEQGSSWQDCDRVRNCLCDLAHPLQVRKVPLFHRQCNYLGHFVRVHRTTKWVGEGDHSNIYPKEPTPLHASPRLPSKSHPHSTHPYPIHLKVLTEQNLSKLGPRNFGF